jgi:hypothetical protein
VKELDLKSTLIAGAIGAAALWAMSMFLFQGESQTPSGSQTSTLASGFTVGVLVQVGVRLLGVS